MEQVTKRPTFEEWQQLLREPIPITYTTGRVWAGMSRGNLSDVPKYYYGNRDITVYPDTDIYYND